MRREGGNERRTKTKKRIGREGEEKGEGRTEGHERRRRKRKFFQEMFPETLADNGVFRIRESLP